MFSTIKNSLTLFLLFVTNLLHLLHDYYNKGIFPCQPVFIVNFTKILHSFLFNFSNKTAKNHHISRKNIVFFRKIIVFSHKKLVFYVDYCHNKVTIKFSGGAAWIFQV
jgi:hypothetical protein